MVVNIDGLKINFNVFGKGRSLILLHGWGCDSKIWESTMLYLSSFAKVVSLDLPGFGKSGFPKKPWPLSNYARILKKIIKELRLEKPIILGHSFGGQIAIKFAVCCPKLVDKLILVDSAGIKPKKGISWWLLFLTAKIGKLPFQVPPFSFLFQNFRRIFYKSIKRTDYLEAGKLKETFLLVIKEDITPLLSKISAPTLIIWGEEDKEVPLKSAQTLLSKIPHSKLHTFENCGHFPFLEKPKEFTKTVEKFVKKDV